MSSNESNKANSLHLYPKMKVYFRKKPVNHKSYFSNAKVNLGIIQIIIKRLSTILVLSSIKIYLSEQFQYQTFQPGKESGVCVRSKNIVCWFIPLSL